MCGYDEDIMMPSKKYADPFEYVTLLIPDGRCFSREDDSPRFVSDVSDKIQTLSLWLTIIRLNNFSCESSTEQGENSPAIAEIERHRE
jgi:hypothetical protein